MSLPYSFIVPNTAVVDSPAFVTEKKHMLLAMVNDLIPTSTPYLEFAGASAVADFGAYFGLGVAEYAQVRKYFGYLSKDGNAPEKLVVARWYKTATAPFIKGLKLSATVTDLKAVTNGSFTVTIGSTTAEVVVNLGSVASYSDVASTIQTAMQKSFAGSTVAYSSVTGGFIIKGATTGSTATIGAVEAGTKGTDLSGMLGLVGAELSQGVNAETYAQFCDRIYHANSSGYSITTLETLTESDITPAVKWLQSVVDGQTYNTVVRLVFNFTDKATALAIASSLSALSYTGYVITYDPYGEFVNVLDCAICATIDYNIANGAINFNFMPAVGYTAITTLGTVVDYQQGLTNASLMQQLLDAKISCVYSVGFGSQETVFYGFGLMAGAFGTEDVQVNESALEQNIQIAIINALASVNKIKLQGKDAELMISSLIATPLDLFKTNGSIAQNGTLSTTDKATIAQVTGNASAADAVEENGYYFQIQPRTAEDIAKRQVRVLIIYLCGGVINRIRIINRIYGA